MKGKKPSEKLTKANKPKTKKSSLCKKHKRKIYDCNFCDKKFQYSNDLRKHLRIHSDERPYSCQKCKQSFRQAGSLKNHIATQHGSNTAFICYYCHKSFPIKERLRLHMRIHSGEKPYKCVTCTREFGRGGQLKQHMLSHFGLRKYRRCTCSELVPFADKVNNEKNNQQDINTPVENKVCIKHLIQSKKFRCSNCGSSYKNKTQLKVHQRIHSGERPYQCQVCEKSFRYANVITSHIRKHTGEKPFSCFICIKEGFAFSQLQHLKAHMRTIHESDKVHRCSNCKSLFKAKLELQEHRIVCFNSAEIKEDVRNRNKLSQLRLSIAILFKKISTEDRLKQLGFNKRLIDNVLIAALESGQQTFCTDPVIPELEKLKLNLNTFLRWTLPENVMNLIEAQKKSIEILLKEITDSVCTPLLV